MCFLFTYRKIFFLFCEGFTVDGCPVVMSGTYRPGRGPRRMVQHLPIATDRRCVFVFCRLLISLCVIALVTGNFTQSTFAQGEGEIDLFTSVTLDSIMCDNADRIADSNNPVDEPICSLSAVAPHSGQVSRPASSVPRRS